VLTTSKPPTQLLLLGTSDGLRLSLNGLPLNGLLRAGCSMLGVALEHALCVASQGHEVVGVDIAPTAIHLAQTKAAKRGLKMRFLVFDALRLPELGMQFDTVLDCGLFHVFDDEDRARYVESLGAALATGGRYHMLCFSELQPGDWGPRRVTQAEIRASFVDGWVIESIEPTVIDIAIDPVGARAWHLSATRN
jgi:SAM-dependent methyltransferase